VPSLVRLRPSTIARIIAKRSAKCSWSNNVLAIATVTRGLDTVLLGFTAEGCWIPSHRYGDFGIIIDSSIDIKWPQKEKTSEDHRGSPFYI
jgi:hypothetical protein